MAEPLHANRTTRAFRTVCKVLHIVDLVCFIIGVVACLVAGPLCIAFSVEPLQSGVEERIVHGTFLLSYGITAVSLGIFLCVPSIIYHAIALKQVQRESHEQFLGLTIAGFLLGDEICAVFSLITYITEGRIARREEL